MSHKALVVVFIVGALAGAAGGAAWLSRSPAPPARLPAPSVRDLAPTARTPEGLARAACVRVDLATQAIRANGDAHTVRSELAAARVLAAEATRRDGRFAALSGGIAALDEAIRLDNPEAAATGLGVTLEECELDGD